MDREMSEDERLDRMTVLGNSQWFGGDGKAKGKLTKYDIRNDIIKQVKKGFDAALVEENKARLNTKIIKEFLELIRDGGMEFNVGGKLLEVSCKEVDDRALLSQTVSRFYLTLGSVGGSDEELICFCDIVGVICIDAITLPMKAVIYNESRTVNNLQEFVEFITKGISRASADCVGLN